MTKTIPPSAVVPSIGLNPYVTGISILLVQLGGRFLTSDFTPSQQAIFGSIPFKLIVVFLILITAVQDIWYAIVLTGCYYVFMYVLFHPQHPLSIMPESLKRFDVNRDGVITMEEVQSTLERERKGINATA